MTEDSGSAEPRKEPASPRPREGLSPKDAAALISRTLDEIEKAVIGKRGFLEKLLASAIADGHVLIEDRPGLAKTLAARSMAAVLGRSFKRIQFTPDLLPSDITGAYVLDRDSGALRLVKGPVFANVVLADEINRAPPKTQSALLEAMEERQTTLEGTTVILPSPFMVIATQNPIEYEGTFPLPEAQLDRFIAKLDIGYPAEEDELRVALGHLAGRDARAEPRPMEEGTFESLAEAAGAVHVDEAVARYAIEIVRATRASERVAVGASPRASIALLRLARVRALMEGRSFVLPDDVKWCSFEVLIHRVILKPSAWESEARLAEVVRAAVSSVRVPKTE